MGQRLWQQHYVSGTPADIQPLPAPHLPAMIREVALQYSQLTAFTQCMPNGLSASLNYQQVDQLSDAFACYLRESLGLCAGDRVAIQLPNCLAYPIIVFGVLKAACVLVNTNPLYTEPEMIHQFSDAGVKVLVIMDMFSDKLINVLPKTTIQEVISVRISDFFPVLPRALIRFVQQYIHQSIPKTSLSLTPLQQALRQGKAIAEPAQKLMQYTATMAADDLALLQYTGGTTGVAKGAMLSHANLMSNMLQMLAMTQKHIEVAKETILTALPLYHIFAFTVNLMGFYFMGAHNILIPSPRPAANLKKAFSRYPISWTSAVNTLFNSIIHEPWFMKHPPKHMKAAVAGGMSLHAPVAKRWETLVGAPIIEGYGLTESSPLLTVNPLGGTIKIGSIGIPAPSTDIRLIDDAGHEVAPGKPGELIAKGPQIMLGYWQRPDETAQVLQEGWLYTGDIAVMDEEGFFTIVDRKKDMINVSGFNVYPNEVEQCIAAHPDVLEVAVIGAPDEQGGEIVKAFVVSKNSSLSEKDIRDYCHHSLTGYKVPRQVAFCSELPKSNVGKILRKDLRISNSEPQKEASDSSCVETH